MSGHIDLHIDSLHKAFVNAFEMVRERHRERDGPAFAGAWVELVSSGLDGVRITSMPPLSESTQLLPFDGTHRIEARSFYVARGGMRGGPSIDVLLQVSFDTEDMICGYGVPMVFRKIPREGRLSDIQWRDLQNTCKQMALATPSGRIVFLSDQREFGQFLRQQSLDGGWMFASDMHSFAGSVIAPRPLRGRPLRDFCLDLASGWIGDPSLSAMEPSRMLDEVLSVFDIAHILQITIRREDRSAIWKQEPLPI